MTRDFGLVAEGVLTPLLLHPIPCEKRKSATAASFGPRRPQISVIGEAADAAARWVFRPARAALGPGDGAIMNGHDRWGRD
jgi:hypothetical protein